VVELAGRGLDSGSRLLAPKERYQEMLTEIEYSRLKSHALLLFVQEKHPSCSLLTDSRFKLD
jgi:hypothetical protein